MCCSAMPFGEGVRSGRSSALPFSCAMDYGKTDARECLEALGGGCRSRLLVSSTSCSVFSTGNCGMLINSLSRKRSFAKEPHANGGGGKPNGGGGKPDANGGGGKPKPNGGGGKPGGNGGGG